MSMTKEEQEKVLDRLLEHIVKEFKLAMTGVVEGSNSLTPMDVLEKRMSPSIWNVGEKITIPMALTLVNIGKAAPNVGFKASCTLKASSAAQEYVELPWDSPGLEPQE